MNNSLVLAYNDSISDLISLVTWLSNVLIASLAYSLADVLAAALNEIAASFTSDLMPVITSLNTSSLRKISLAAAPNEESVSTNESLSEVVRPLTNSSSFSVVSCPDNSSSKLPLKINSSASPKSSCDKASAISSFNNVPIRSCVSTFTLSRASLAFLSTIPVSVSNPSTTKSANSLGNLS